ncbi:MAG: hypothetical protein NVV67_01135 [Pseudoxanthomonas sp.]|nr:hypothetical protein [Pseudoxanthomonas sp.]
MSDRNSPALTSRNSSTVGPSQNSFIVASPGCRPAALRPPRYHFLGATTPP